MSIMTSEQTLPQTASWDMPWDLLQRAPRSAWTLLLAAAILVAGHEVSHSLQSPAQSIKNALAAAAAEMTAPSGPQATLADLDAIQQHFSAQSATIDARYWPQVAVTLHGVDKSSCVEAATIAGRVEGLVVVQLDHYQTVAQCTESNDMTWWLLP